jgi:hypothetical protein
MGHEDRDRKFEQALARHLRVRGDAAGARNEADAHSAVPDETGGAVECPDAATLAAFHEGMLSNEEMNATAEHIAGCSRCQQILLLLETTDEIPLATEAENDLKMRESVLSTGALHADDAIHKPSSAIAGQAKPALRAPQDISRGRGFKALRWAAPAGAIAAGLLVWFVARDKVQTVRRFENVQVAQEQPRDERLAAPRPLPAAPAAEPTIKTRQLNERRKDVGRIKQPAEEPDGLRAPKNSPLDSIASRVNPGSGNRTSGANIRQLPLNGRNYSSLSSVAPEISSRQADVSVTAAAPMPAPAASDEARAQSAAPSGQAAQNAAKQSANATQTVVDHTDGNGSVPLIPTEQVVTNDKLEFSPSLKKVGAENAKIILGPKGRVRWRLLSAGRIERSSDGGVNWVAQNSGVNVELIGGSAPSNTVCWIFGRGGTILKTTDGGSHWTKVAWPDAGEIVGIQGLDAMHAIVYEGSLGLPARLATNDGGETWFRTNK